MKNKIFIPVMLFLSGIVILLITSYPSIGWWDSGLYAVHSRTLGVPNPGGSILFILLGRIFSYLFFFLSTIKRIALVSICATSAASVFFYFTMLEIINTFQTQKNRTVITLSSFFTALSLPFLHSIWSESHISRVYSLGLLLAAVLSFISVKIWLADNNNYRMRLIFLLVFILTLDFSAHRLNSPFLPFLFLLIIYSLRTTFLNYKFWLAAIVFCLTAISIHFFLFIRSGMNTPLTMENTQNFKNLLSWINMKRVSSESNVLNLFNRRASLWDYQIKFMYLRYFCWNFFGKGNPGSLISFTFPFATPFILGCTGFIYSFIKNRKIWFFILFLFILYSIGLIVYSNVNDGFHNIREIDRLFLPSFLIFLFWTGTGLYFILSYAIRYFKGKALTILILFIGFMILPVNVILSNWKNCDRSGYYFPEDFAYNLLSSCEENGVLFTNGDNDTFPLWYLQQIEHIRTDVLVINLPLLNTGFYLRQVLRELPVEPSMNLDSLTHSQWDTTQTISLAPPDSIMSEKDSIIFKLTPYFFGNKPVIMKNQKTVISFLYENKWKRPVYFASTVSPKNLLGLQDYLSMTGIVFFLTPIKNAPVDAEKLEKNLLMVYKYRNINNPSVPIEKPFLRIFNNYRNGFIRLIRHYIDHGDKNRAQDVLSFMEKHIPSWRYSEEENRFIKDIQNVLY